MCDTLVHRGPDDEGIWTGNGVGLGMRRLAIIDRESGQQPLFNEDRSVVVVFNGEIYNFRELKSSLRARGHRFETETDGEVIPHLWEEEGTDFLHRLNGMFAIALYDVRARTLLLARDPFGIKPLYYSLSGDHLVFGSEVKAVLASGRVPRNLDLTALSQFLTWEYVPSPRTLLREVKKLPPGSLLRVDLPDFRSNIERWWSLPCELRKRRSEDLPTSREGWADHIDHLLAASVRRQLVSDVPLGAFLSGGVDSSLVASAMDRPRTFSIGFEHESYNELDWSQQVADVLGTRHTTEVIRPDAVALFEPLMEQMDDPIGDFSIFPTYLVSRLARRDVTVALSGDGGDEVFGGYETYVAQEAARLWERIPSFLRSRMIEPLVRALPPRPAKKGLINKARRFVEGLQYDAALGHTRWRRFLSQGLAERLFTPDAWRGIEEAPEDHVLRFSEELSGRSAVDRGLYVDLQSYLTDNCLVKTDRMSMACSLEVRVPFLDPDLVVDGFKMPTDLKVNRGRTKVLLKEVAARHVPKETVYRPKEGFSIPIKHWLRGDFRPLVEDLLSEERLSRQGLFDPDTVSRLREEHMEATHNHSHLLWSLVVFQDWHDRWLVP